MAMDVPVFLIAVAASVADPPIAVPCLLWGALFRRFEVAMLVAFAWVVARDIAGSLLFHDGARIPPEALTAHISAGPIMAAAAWLAADSARAWRAAKTRRAARQ